MGKAWRLRRYIITKYIANFEFGSNITPEEAQAWFDAIKENLPDGVEGNVRTIPLILDLADVTQAHVGNKITIRGFHKFPPGKKDKTGIPNRLLVDPSNLSGVLEHVFPTGGHQERRTLVIDGHAYEIPAYSLVELGEW